MVDYIIFRQFFLGPGREKASGKVFFIVMEHTLDGIRDIKLYQRRKGYRFSLDALLLFDFVSQRAARKIADLGAGSGIIGLLLSKSRFPEAETVLVELQDSLYKLALRNIRLNGLGEHVKAVRKDIRDIPQRGGPGLKAGSFDFVVSNPPFRRKLSGRLSEDPERAAARHELSVSLEDILAAASYLLKNGGRFCMIYHPERLAEVFDKMKSKRLEPKRMRLVHGRRLSAARMALLESVKGGEPGLSVLPPLFVYDTDNSYTGEVREIYGL
jgi:tRNA1Val (adenine37-N6)-methyltransferase